MHAQVPEIPLDGKVLQVAVAAMQLQRIVDDLSSYYLFGYYSTNTKLDGRFRNITVRVNRPGARVRARRGYRGRTADELISGASGAAAAEAPDSLTTALTPVVSFNARMTSATIFG